MAEASAGDIVMVAGLPDIYIGETICSSETQVPFARHQHRRADYISKFSGQRFPARRPGRKIRHHPANQRTVGKRAGNKCRFKIDFSAGDFFKVYGRGELHIAILLENMRREGFELKFPSHKSSSKKNFPQTAPSPPGQKWNRLKK